MAQGSSVVKNLPTNVGDVRDTDLITELRRSWEAENCSTFQYFLPGKFHGQSLVGYKL